MSEQRRYDDPSTAVEHDDSGRHPVNVGHLVMGLAFLGIIAVWALIEADTVSGRDIRWLLPLPWVLAGVGGLLAVTLTGRRRPRPAYDTPQPLNHEPTEEDR
jgi:hypothetical protein